METKRCNTCGEVKELSEFGRRARRPDGYDLHCKECHKIWEQKTKDKYRSDGRCWCGRPVVDGKKRCVVCRDAQKRIDAVRRKRNKENGICQTCHKNPAKGYWECEQCAARRYVGKSFDLRKEFFEKQNRTCPICLKPLDGFIHKIHSVLDHDHETGKIRGLVHCKCNLLINDLDLAAAKRLVEYLDAAPGREHKFLPSSLRILPASDDEAGEGYDEHGVAQEDCGRGGDDTVV